jgi:hypothetical protein
MASKVRRASAWLAWIMEPGPLPSATVRQAAKTNGFAPKEIQAAKAKARVISIRQGFGPGGQWAIRHAQDIRPPGPLIQATCDLCHQTISVYSTSLPRPCLTLTCYGVLRRP